MRFFLRSLVFLTYFFVASLINLTVIYAADCSCAGQETRRTPCDPWAGCTSDKDCQGTLGQCWDKGGAGQTLPYSYKTSCDIDSCGPGNGQCVEEKFNCSLVPTPTTTTNMCPPNYPAGCPAGLQCCAVYGQPGVNECKVSCGQHGQQCTDCCNPYADPTCGEPIPPRPASLGPWDANCVERKGKDFICCLAPGSSANCRIAAPAKLDGYIALSTGGRVGQSTSSDGGHCGSPYGASCATCNPPGPVGEDKACCWNQINGCESQCNPVIPGVNIAEGGTNNPSWWCPTQVIMQGWCSVNAEGQDSWWFCKGTVDTNGLNFSFNNLTVGSRTFQVTGVPLGYTCNYTFTIEGINKSGTGCTFSQELKANNYLMVVLVPPGKISGNVYKNTTGLTCNTGSLQSGRTVTIAGTGGSTYACSLTTNGSGYYDSDSCSSKPPRGSSYTVSVSHNATDESCLSCGGSSCSQSVSLAAAPSITQNFTVFPLKNAWFQTGYGDVHGNGGVGATMPIDTCTSATCTAGGCCPYLSLGTANTAGVVSTGGNFTGNVETKNLFSNPNNWKVKDAATENFTGFGGNQTKYDYVRFSAKLQNCVTEDKENFFNPGHFKDLGKDPGGNCYKFSPGGAGTSYRGNTRTVASDQKIIILVDGDITFNPLIKVTPGGFFALISSGNITFDTGIGSSTPLNPASSAASQMQGIYIADGSIDTSVSTNQFLGGGMFIADANLDGTGSLNFNRNLDSGGTNYNNSYPSEYFEYRPDFLVNFPVNFGFNRLTWQEVAP